MEAYRTQMQANSAGVDRMLQRVSHYLPAHGNRQTSAVNAKPVHWYSPSSLVLIGVNLIPLYGVLKLGWPVFPILLLFWLENVVIGILNTLRMLLADPWDPVLWASKFIMIPFFCIHYGMFTAIHGMFVIRLFVGEHYGKLMHDFWPTTAAVQAIQDFISAGRYSVSPPATCFPSSGTTWAMVNTAMSLSPNLCSDPIDELSSCT